VTMTAWQYIVKPASCCQSAPVYMPHGAYVREGVHCFWWFSYYRIANFLFSTVKHFHPLLKKRNALLKTILFILHNHFYNTVYIPIFFFFFSFLAIHHIKII